MLHKLQINSFNRITITIQANEQYSSHKIEVEKNEVYQFVCDKHQRWKDWFICSSPEGFFNLFAWLAGLRVKGVKCFCLCGTYNDQDQKAFSIGINKIETIKENGTLSFFANDTNGFYYNNHGSVKLQITRLK